MTRAKAFWLSALVTLFCLLPLYLLLVGGQVFGSEAAQAEAGKEDVPKLTAGAADSLTLLLAVRGETPGAALVRLDAWQGRADCLVLPSDTLLPRADGEEETLADCLAAAGPLQLNAALERLTGSRCEKYIELDADTLAGVFESVTPLVNWNSLGKVEDLALLRRFAFNGGEGTVSSGTAAVLVRRSEADAAQLAALRASLYGAFLEEGLPILKEPVLALLRSDDAPLTDISAVDLYGVERLLTLLAADLPPVTAAVPDTVVEDGAEKKNAAAQDETATDNIAAAGSAVKKEIRHLTETGVQQITALLAN